MKKVVGIADMKTSNKIDEELITYSLGSCIAVVVFDPIIKVGGMIHIMLPDSTIQPEVNNPYKFVDSGVPLLYKTLFKMGAKRSRVITKIVGGANVMDKNNFFNIGKRNYASVRKMLWRNNMMIKGEDVGGTKSRTVSLNISTGKVIVKNAREEYEI